MELTAVYIYVRLLYNRVRENVQTNKYSEVRVATSDSYHKWTPVVTVLLYNCIGTVSVHICIARKKPFDKNNMLTFGVFDVTGPSHPPVFPLLFRRILVYFLPI